jgi:uncharacterized protein YehS (DUF1456 family)
MINNDVLRSVRFMLKLNDSALANLVQLGGGTATPAEVIAWLKPDEDPGFAPCRDVAMAQFLDGLILHRRGPNDGAPPRPTEQRMTNNLVLKKLRVAFELKEDDMLAVLHDAGFEVSRPELSALFRAPTHKNYRACGDQLLRNFLKGLTARVRPE